MPLKVESTSIPEHRLSDGGALPLTFRDALPDNWGRLMLEAQYGRKLDDTDALLMTNADRIGAMVFSETLPIESNLPITNSVALEDMAEAVRRLELSMEITPNMPRLLQRGGTLGGARPKATFIHENKRWIANFLRKAMIMILNYLKYAYLSLRLCVALRFQQQSWKKLTPAMPLNDTAIEVLNQIDREGAYEHLFINNKTKKPYVKIAKIWDKLRNKAGLPHLRLHDLRHQAASHLINSGSSLYIVQQILGHSDPSVTQRYAHLSMKSLNDASDNASAIIKGAMKHESLSEV